MTNGSKLLKQFFNSNNFKGSFQSCKNISPASNLIECCFIGRSNVGKSSIINAITKTKNLAKISNTPGRTQSINIFEINKCINLVDLPGYGFAKVSKVMRYNLSILIEDYIKNRSNFGKFADLFSDLTIVQWKPLLNSYPSSKYGGPIFDFNKSPSIPIKNFKDDFIFVVMGPCWVHSGHFWHPFATLLQPLDTFWYPSVLSKPLTRRPNDQGQKHGSAELPKG